MCLRVPWIPAASAVLVLLAGATGCSDDGDASPAPAVQTAANGDVFNDADADFATAVVQHHALALLLVDMSRSISPDVTAIAAEILEVESIEIQTATAWLADWDVPVPETIRDHANAHAAERGEDVGIPGGDLPGMPDHDDLAELERLPAAEAEQGWLELMIAHHEGMVEIAEEEVDAGRFSPAVELAEVVASTQRDQIEQMRALLDE